MIAEDTYLSGVLHGPSKKWNGRGTLLVEGAYKSGKMDGVWRELRGQEWTSEKNYREGVLHGPYHTHFAGRMSTDGQYLEGERDGEWVKTSRFDKTTNTAAQHYRGGVRDGKWVYTSSKLGEPIEITFKDGLLVDSSGELKSVPLLKRIEALSRPDKPRDPLTERIADALFEQTDLEYSEVPLGEIVEDLGERFRLAVSPDRFALERNKITIKAPITINNPGVPLILGLAHIAKHQGLTLDYRYHSIWLTRQDFAENWKRDPTGALALVPPRGSKLEKAFSWEPSRDRMPGPSKPVDLFSALEKEHGVKIEFLDEATRAKCTDNAREVGKFRSQHAIRDLLQTPVQ